MRKKAVKPQHQASISQELKDLRNNRNIEHVEAGIQTFVEKWDPVESAFVQYFKTNYVNRKHKWAVCYRNPSIPNTTVHAEAFHNILKRVYCSKRNRYMKSLLETLMRFEEDTCIKFKG